MPHARAGDAASVPVLCLVRQPEPAVEMHRLFIDAWEHADPEFQPLVDRARRAVEALEGTVQPIGR